LIGPLQRFIGAFHDVSDDLVVEVMQRLLGLPFEGVHPDVKLPQVALERLSFFREFLLHLFRECFHFLFCHRAVVFQGDQPEADRRFFEPESALVTERGEVVEEGLLFSFRLLDDLRLGIEVLLAFEGPRECPGGGPR
jgi:hypothetical protein